MNPNAIPAAARSEANAPRPAMPERVKQAHDAGIRQAIADAARRSDVAFDYLVAQAQMESAMNPAARAPTSSATGLYQFIESTWLHTMQRHGARFGLADIAQQIGTSRSGAPHVANPATRSAILDMRTDPHVASLMAAALANDNSAHLAPILGREPDQSELYLAHFLGANGAGRFLGAMARDPSQVAAPLFARPAAANPSVFYAHGGAPRSLAGVMEHLRARLVRAGAEAPAGRASTNVATAPSRPLRTSAALSRQAGAPLALPAAAPSAPAWASVSNAPGQPMSSVLANAFGGTREFASPRASTQVRRAYDQLRAFGL